MRTSRLFSDQPLVPGQAVRLPEPAAHYVTRVLRLRAGEAVVLFNGDGFDYGCRVDALGHNGVSIRVDEALTARPESPLDLQLAQGVSRGERMDQTLQKATELGVRGVQPLLTERVEVRLDDRRTAKRMEHWQGVVRSACEQSGRAVLPAVSAPLDLRHWLHREDRGLCLLLDPDSSCSLAGVERPQGRLSLVVGPEGGFSDAERDSLLAAGAVAVSLGPRVLRTETAGPAAIAVLQARFGDF